MRVDALMPLPMMSEIQAFCWCLQWLTDFDDRWNASKLQLPLRHEIRKTCPASGGANTSGPKKCFGKERSNLGHEKYSIAAQLISVNQLRNLLSLRRRTGHSVDICVAFLSINAWARISRCSNASRDVVMSLPGQISEGLPISVNCVVGEGCYAAVADATAQEVVVLMW